MSWTSPKTWGSETLTSSDMNTYVRDDLLYLYGISQGVTFSGVQVTRAAATSIPTASYTDVTWTAEPFDYGGWWSSGTDIVVPAGAIPSGYTTIAIHLIGFVVYASDSAGARRLVVTKNGTAINGANISVTAINGDTTDVSIAQYTTVAAGDIITMQVYQSSGGNLNASNMQLTVVRHAPAT